MSSQAVPALNTLQKEYFAGRIVMAVIHLTVSFGLLVIIYIAYKSKKQLLFGDEKRSRYSYFVWSLVAIIFSIISGLVCLLLDNNFIISLDFFNNHIATSLITSADGVGALLWSISKFAVYCAFASHVLYLDDNHKIYTKTLYVITICCGILILGGGILFVASDLMEVDLEKELLQVDGMNDLFIVSYQDNTAVRNIGYFICLCIETLYFIFIMYQYHILIKTSSSKDVQNEAVQGNVLLFGGSLSTFLLWICGILAIPIFYILPWIDLMIGDITICLLLLFAKDSYRVLCGCCHSCWIKCHGINTNDQHIEPLYMQVHQK